MNIIRKMITTVGLLCILLGLLTPLSSVLLIGIGTAIVIVGMVVPFLFMVKEKRLFNSESDE